MHFFFAECGQSGTSKAKNWCCPTSRIQDKEFIGPLVQRGQGRQWCSGGWTEFTPPRNQRMPFLQKKPLQCQQPVAYIWVSGIGSGCCFFLKRRYFSAVPRPSHWKFLHNIHSGVLNIGCQVKIGQKLLTFWGFPSPVSSPKTSFNHHLKQ